MTYSFGARRRMLDVFHQALGDARISICKVWICALASAMALLPISAPAQQAVPATNLTASDLEPWLDGFMASALRINEVQGAVVAVVKDGKVITQKGYGFADAAMRIPVDPENTLFRPGSISKLFVWTSIMQLVEQGKIDLDADINTYLDFKIAGIGGATITVRHLLTHRAGFEEVAKATSFSDPVWLKPLDAFVKGYIPKRIFAPGSTPAYSNYGASLAAYIVQRVSSMPFETYVERNVFAPLGMTHSTFRQPLPEALLPFLSKGYEVTGGEPQPFELINSGPAGALTTSTADMVRFMIAHLDAERGSDGKLLKPETARLMHRSVIKNLPELNGMALGFYENNVNGHKVIAHGGDLILFHSDLFLFIDDGVGIYVSMNSAGKNTIDIRNKLLYEFADRYMPIAVPSAAIEPAVAKAHLAEVEGTYVWTRRLDSSFARIADLTSEAVIAADEKGFLSLKGLFKPTRFREIRPYLWQDVGSKELLSVHMKDGRPTAMSVNGLSPIIEFRPITPLQSAAILFPAIGAALLILVVSIVVWPFSAVARRIYRVVSNPSVDQRRVFFLRQLASSSLVVSAIVWALLLATHLGGFSEADEVQILATQVVSIVCVSVATFCVLLIVRSLFAVKKSRLQTLGTTIWLAATLFVIWFYYNYNFLKIGADL